MPEDTTAAIKALIQQVASLTAIVQKQDEAIQGVKDHNARLLDQVKDTKRAKMDGTVADTDDARLNRYFEEHEKTIREHKAFMAGVTSTGQSDAPRATGGPDIILTREQARHRATYQEAQALATARGVQLRVAPETVQSWRKEKSSIVQSKTFSFDDTHDGVRWVRADMHSGAGNVNRQMAAEREGLKLRTFRSLDDLPAHARQKFELMEAAANAES